MNCYSKEIGRFCQWVSQAVGKAQSLERRGSQEVGKPLGRESTYYNCKKVKIPSQVTMLSFVAMVTGKLSDY